MGRLTSNGWRVSILDADHLDWWADEQWCIDSTWSPVGLRVFLTFLVDAQWEGERRKGEGVWALGVAVKMPQDARQAQQDVSLSLGRDWKARLEDLLEKLNQLRNEAFSP